MTGACGGGERGWSPRRTAGVAALLLAGQAGLILLLGRGGRLPVPPNPPGFHLQFPLSDQPGETWVEDPALFVLPRPEGFSGRVWAPLSAPEYPATEWTERPRWLDPPVDRLGEAMRGFVATNGLGPIEVAQRPEPRLEHPEVYPTLDLTPARSELVLEGRVAQRRLLREPILPTFPATNITLTCTRVQVAVDADGRVFNVVPVSPSGSKEADLAALELARALRFEPLPGAGRATELAGGNPLTWGRLEFRWLTTAPPPVTNAAPPAP